MWCGETAATGCERLGPVTVTAADGVYYDPYDVQINADPYLAFRGLREEAPLYYNEQHDFYALSRFADVDRAIVDHETFSSARGAIIELIKANIDMPHGVVIFEDPPIHDVHRKLLARMFTPRKINDLEPKIREFCARSLDPLIGTSGFDFVADLGVQMPMRVIGTLLGVPEEYQEAARVEEILKRFPEWEVDLSGATLSPTSTVRGWEAMPAVIG